MNTNRRYDSPVQQTSLFSASGDIYENVRQLTQTGTQTGRPSLTGLHQNGSFQRIYSAASSVERRSDKENDRNSLGQTEQLLVGLYTINRTFIYLASSNKNQVNLHIGTSGSASNLDKLIKNTVCGALLQEISPVNIYSRISSLPFCAGATGFPAVKKSNEGIETIFRVLLGAGWTYLIMAKPVGIELMSTTLRNLAEELQRVKNTYLRPMTAEQDNNPLASYYRDLLEFAFNQYKNGHVQGCWQTRIFLFTESEALLNFGMASFMSYFCSNSDMVPNPARISPCSNLNEVMNGGTILTTSQLSAFADLPRNELPGYQIRPVTTFAIALPEFHQVKPVAIGKVQDSYSNTGEWLEIDLDSLTKHTLLTGVTGSGKTQTCQFLLDQLWREHRVPYLVIEPVKGEYSNMKNITGNDELTLYKLGDSKSAHFYLNPFELQAGVPLQSHIDSLRSLFSATFAGLYPPMPYILEEALYQVYRTKGWNMLSEQKNDSMEFPTLNDFCNEVDQIVQHSGYDRETVQNISTALKVRLNSLRVGTKGLILNTTRSTPMTELVAKPSIIELTNINDIEAVAFIMGLILIRLYEYLAQFKKDGKIKHVTVIEEAHRLLSGNLVSSGNIEVSNIRSQAVESFCNMLAEVRTYGEGFIIIDQSPTKLHSDAVKGTNLKIVHRLVAEDDRQSMAGSTAMDEKQKKFLATLNTGEAVVYAEGFYQPFWVNVPDFWRFASTNKVKPGNSVK